MCENCPAWVEQRQKLAERREWVCCIGGYTFRRKSFTELGDELQAFGFRMSEPHIDMELDGQYFLHPVLNTTPARVFTLLVGEC